MTNSPFTSVRAVAFDLDGTLIDSLPDLADSANHVRAHFGLPPLPEALIATFIGDGVTQLIHRAISGHRDGRDDARIAEGLAQHSAYYGAHLARRTRLYPHAAEMLAALHARNIPVALVTNKVEQHARALLAHFGIARHFRAVYGGDTLPVRKPAPDQLLAVAGDFALEPAQILMVGDSRNDIISAKAAGAPSLLVTFGYADRDALMQNPATRPDAHIDTLAELPELLP